LVVVAVQELKVEKIRLRARIGPSRLHHGHDLKRCEKDDAQMDDELPGEDAIPAVLA